MELKRQAELSGKLADEVEKIYLASFPPCERKEFSELIRDVNSGREMAFVAKEAGTAVGFALVQRLSCGDIYLLGYLAVAEERRGRGIGSSLFHYVARTLRCEENAEGLLFEVEPSDGGSDDEMDLRKRRVAFYHQNGAWTVTEASSYRMPDLSGEGSVEMRLMWLALHSDRESISGQELRDCIVSIYKDCYGRSEDDPVLQSVLCDMAV